MKFNQVLTNSIFFILLLSGLNIAGDYGLSWDSMQRGSGIRSAGYIMTKIGIQNTLENDYDVYPRDHNDAYGVIFDLVSIFSEKLFKLTDKKEIYTMRHRLNFLFYFTGCLFYFLLSKKIFGFKIALLSLFLYAFHPRLLAHGFFNPKDSILQSFVVITLYPIHLALKNNKSKWFIFSGIMMGICVATRMVMLYLPVLFFLSIFIIHFKYFNDSDYKNIKSLLKKCVLTLFFFILSLIISLPILWEDPISNFLWAFNIMKDFPWGGNVLFMGENIPSSNLPWYYIPVWYGITTPLTFIILFILGLIKLFFLTNTFSIRKNIILYFSLAGILFPLLSIIILKSTLYDGWRHFYFIYPFISLISVFGYLFLIAMIKKMKYFKIRFITLFMILFLITFPSVSSFYKMHPHQNTYFNFLAGSDPFLRYEGDYWGVSYKQGLEELLKTYDGDIFLNVGNFPGKNNLQMIDKNDRNRIKIVDFKNADYFMTNFRSQLKDYIKSNEGISPFQNEVFSIKYGEMKVLGTYDLK